MKNNLRCIFTSDLHGNKLKYENLFTYIANSSPDAVFLGGDLSRSLISRNGEYTKNTFFSNYILNKLLDLQSVLKESYPEIFLILGNDDSKNLEEEIIDIEKYKLWKYINEKSFKWKEYDIFGYSFVPPTPFLLKDWERYDISQYVDPGSIAPHEGLFTFKNRDPEENLKTIKNDLEIFATDLDFKKTICLFHSPPYKTALDRGDLDGKFIDHVPIDVHLGSIAIYNFIEKYQPVLTLHGHIHESTRLTGSWKDKIGKTKCFNGSHDGPELSIITFNPENPESATRILI